MNPMLSGLAGSLDTVAVVPVLIGPLQALLAILPYLLAALGSALLALFKPSTVKRLLRVIWAQKLPLLALAAAIWGATYAVRRYWPARAGAVSAAQTGAADWLQFRGSSERRGWVADGRGDPVRGGVVWNFRRGADTLFYSSPTLVGNRLYVCSAQVSMFNRQGTGYVFCFDADTGALVWQGGPPGYRATFSSPAVQGNRLAVGEGLHEARDSRVSVLDLDRNGALLWTYRTRSHTESSPIFHKGRVYFGAGRDGWRAFEIEPDSDGNPRLVWHAPGEKYPDASGSAGAYRDWILVPMGRWGGEAVAALDADTGEEVWRIQTPYPVFSGPTVSEALGLCFIGMGTGNMIQTAEEALPGELERLRQRGATEAEIEAARARLGPAGEVWAIDLATREVRWRYRTAQSVIAQIALDGDFIYFGARDGSVHKVAAATGERAAVWQGHDPILASPAVAKDHVYVVTNAGRLVALDKRRLTPQWDEPIGGAPSISSPAVARGRVYVGTTGNGLLCIGSAERAPAAPLWAGDRGGPGRSGWEEGTMLGARGNYAWSYRPPLADGIETPARVTAAPAALSVPSEDAAGAPRLALFVPWSDDERHALERVEFADGPGRAPRRAWLAPVGRRIVQSPALVGDTVFIVEGRPGETGRALKAFAAETGEVHWSHPVADGASGALTASSRRLLAADRADGLSAFDLSAPAAAAERSRVQTAPAWTAKVGRVVGAPAMDADVAVVAVDGPPALVVLDLESGAELRRMPLASAPSTGPLLDRDTVWVGAAGGVEGYDLVTGEPRARAAGGAPVDRLVAQGDRLAWVTEAGVARFADRATGEERRSFDGVMPVFAPLLGDTDAVLWAEGALQRVVLDTGERSFWTRLTASWPGLPETAPVMAGRHLIFGTAARGLVGIGWGN